MHFGIVGEHKSDVDTLAVIVRRLLGNDGIKVNRKGLNGGGELFRKGVAEIESMKGLGCDRFIACHDSDGQDSKAIHEKLRRELLRPTKTEDCGCSLVPVEELEAWILADLKAVTKIFTSWRPNEIRNPEGVPSPKEHLEKLSRIKARPRYDHVTHNERIAKYLDLDLVATKCPSFRTLVAFVRES